MLLPLPVVFDFKPSNPNAVLVATPPPPRPTVNVFTLISRKVRRVPFNDKLPLKEQSPVANRRIPEISPLDISLPADAVPMNSGFEMDTFPANCDNTV